MIGHDKGFTLIELLIVTVIMGGLVALVGPLTVEFVEKSRAQDERIRFERWLKRQSFKAFSSDQTLTYYFKGQAIYQVEKEDSQNLLLYNQTSEKPLRKFEHLFFEPQTTMIFESGYTTPDCLTYHFRGRNYQIDMSGNCEKSSTP